MSKPKPDPSPPLQIEGLYERAWSLRRSDASKSMHLATLLRDAGKGDSNDLIMAQGNLVLAVHRGYSGDLDTCLNTAKSCFEIFEHHGDTLSLVRACNIIGFVYIVRNELGLAFEVLLRGLIMARELNIVDMQIYFLYNIGEIYKTPSSCTTRPCLI